MNFNNKHRKNDRHQKEPVKNGKVKKPFDKKAFREKMYSKNHKILQWENQRRKQILQELGQEVSLHQRNKRKDLNESVAVNDNKQFKFKKSARAVAKREEKLNRYNEMRKKQEEKAQALEKYKQKRTEKYKKLSRKTKKGQPIMKDRIEMLLQQIQLSQSSR
ncbi:rRNA-processing protein FYV7 [Chelonus insularis]|uniref:rRNA-processing protein FYV7 n=1 Tax=Chelonus insularis TaxID=460826 RepID=UPI00158AB24F|nr:rRNA-processing protein FYV7 [Chelonus insularis]